MPFNLAWIIAGVGAILALAVWAKTKRFGPAAAVFGGGLFIMIMADPSMLSDLADAGKGLFKKAIEQGLNNS